MVTSGRLIAHAPVQLRGADWAVGMGGCADEYFQARVREQPRLTDPEDRV